MLKGLPVSIIMYIYIEKNNHEHLSNIVQNHLYSLHKYIQLSGYIEKEQLTLL